MGLRQIKFIPYGIGFLIGVLFIASICLYFFSNGAPFSQGNIAVQKRDLPPSSFSFSQETYASLGDTSLLLKTSPPRLHLPDLRPHLIFYGRNGRPDASYEVPKLHFALQGGKALVAAFPQEKIYLIYDKKLTGPCKYTFSPDNCETLLSMTCDLEGNEAKVRLTLRDQEGHVISDGDGPQGNFSLPEKELVRTSQQGVWEIGKWRVDGTLLARQKARWMGVDRFLEKHGGDEFSTISGKQRIDFTDNEEFYSVFVKMGDFLVWKENRWQESDPSKETVDKPLLLVKKVEDRVMMLELWDVGGKSKVALNLIRTPEPFAPHNISRDFRFIGARTKTQVVFQINQLRMIVKPNDWFLLTAQGWKKLKTTEDIDDYVNRKLTGPLFVFEEVAKKDDRPVMIGTLFNPGRTEMHPIEVAMLPAGATPTAEQIVPQQKPIEEVKPQVITPLATH